MEQTGGMKTEASLVLIADIYDALKYSKKERVRID
jgi:hypothetical protein